MASLSREKNVIRRNVHNSEIKVSIDASMHNTELEVVYEEDMDQNGFRQMTVREISVVATSNIERAKTLLSVCVLTVLVATCAGYLWMTWKPCIIAALSIGCLFLYLHFVLISKESLLLITSLGLQISSECYTGRQATKFIPLEAVHDVIIHEAVTMHKVVYYVAVLLRKTRDSRRPDSIVPVFLHTMPRLETLREILSAVHKTIHFDGPNREAARGNQDLYDR